MANIFNVARYILDKGGSTSIWKLQKLCYYSQAWSLAWTGEPLFQEDFEAWSNGPVCPELYRALGDLFVASLDDIPENLEDPSALSKEQIEIIDHILEDYGYMQPYELREQTHVEAPWIDARGGLPDGEKCQTVISKSAIGAYYGGL